MAISGVSLASSSNFQNPNDPRQQFAALAKAISSGPGGTLDVTA